MTLLTTVASVSVATTASMAAWYGLPMTARLLQTARLRAACRREGVLVLSYDDGPCPMQTPRVLDRLAHWSAPATFFMAGQRAEQHPEIVDRVRQAGHEIGEHTYAHCDAWRASPLRTWRDIAAGQRALRGKTSEARLFRPPYGKVTLGSWWQTRRARRRLAWWTMRSRDDQVHLPDVDAIVDDLRHGGGGVVLMHDLAREPDRDQFVLECTDRLLSLAEREGWTLRTLGSVLRGAA